MISVAVGFVVLFTLIFLRIPIAIALILVGFTGFAVLNGLNPAFTMVALVTSSSTMSYQLSVVPLFILMGNLIAGAGVSADLFRAAQAFVGHKRGGLAQASVLACGGFAAVCGSSVASVVTMGKVCIPPMRQYGYADRLSTATIAAGSTLGVLIPPSIIMVIYGIITETHIGKLFAAGFVPGLIAIAGYLLAVLWTVRRDPASAPPAERAGAVERLIALRKTWTVIALFVLVLGGIYAGFFTAVEAGAIGSAGALILAIWRRTSSKAFFEILTDTAQTTAILFFMIIGANIFSEFMNYTGAHETVLDMVTQSGISPLGTIVIICLIYVVLGALLDELAMLLLTLPMFFPIVIGLGYDPVWFGVLVVVLCELGMIMPPMGINLFIMRTVTPDVPLSEIIRGVVPFIAVDLARVALIALFPILSLWLPNRLFS